MKKKILSLLLGLTLALSLSIPASAAPAPTTQDIFNTVSLTPRESTNPTIAKYVESIMASIDPNDTLSTYDKAAAAYKWVSDNIEFAKHYTVTYDEDYHYMQDSALYGFKNKKGPCEVDSAPLVYLLRYIGLDAQWAIGFSGEQYHLWTEVIVGGNTYVFDSYPNMEKSFQKYSGLVEMGATVVGGFTHGGYVTGGGGENEKITASNVGTMDKMRRLDGAADTFAQGVAAAPAGKSYKIGADYDGDGADDYSWVISNVTKVEKIHFADLATLIAGTNKTAQENLTPLMKDVAGKEVNVYTIKIGDPMDNSGATGAMICKLSVNNGKLVMNNGDYDPSAMAGSTRDNLKIETTNGVQHYVHGKGDFYAIAEEGYYILEIYPWVSQRLDTNPQSKNFGMPKADKLYRDGYAVLHAVK